MAPRTLTNRYGLELNDRGSELETPCPEFWTGSAGFMDHLDFYESVLIHARDFTPVDNWSNGFRYVFVNRDGLAIFTYCEGDLDLTVDSDPAVFMTRLAKAADFYATAA